MARNNVLVFILFVMIPMAIFSRESTEEEFWNWFSENEEMIFSVEQNQERVLNSISEKLARYQSGLVFEISQVIDGKREFILSADGIAKLFPAVEALTRAAPDFDRWIIIAFRPRLEDYASFELQYGDKHIDPSKIWISYRIEDGNFDLILLHPEYSEEERDIIVSASFILLDMALGEYDVVTGIRYIDHQKIPDNPVELGLKPFTELRSVFDRYKAEHKSD